jgi:hypothetical protein
MRTNDPSATTPLLEARNVPNPFFNNELHTVPCRVAAGEAVSVKVNRAEAVARVGEAVNQEI